MAGGLLKRGETWYIRYEEPIGPDGKRKQKMIACKEVNKKQAEQKLRDIRTSLNTGSYIDPSKMSFGEYLEKWLDHACANLEVKTHERYAELVKRHIVPALGNHHLDKLRPLDIQEYMTKALKAGRLDGKGGLAPKTVRNIHGVIHASLSQAVRWQMLTVNPADAVDPPKVPRREVRTASGDQIHKLIDATGGSQYRVPILIVMSTGMRRGEALGLKWEDFNAERHTLCVRRSISQVVGRVFPKEPKTGKSRVVVIPDTLVTELVRHREQQSLNKSLLRDDYKDDGWICASGDGSLITPNALGKGFMRLARAAQVKTTLHGLRHTQATQLIMAGVPAKVVSERLGHANTGITQDLYTHVLPHSQQQAADVVERLMTKEKTDGS